MVCFAGGLKGELVLFPKKVAQEATPQDGILESVHMPTVANCSNGHLSAAGTSWELKGP